ncbi:Putative inner membrane protein [Izhakiella capsodis]|uniref:Inner membrane protein n=1 Tax=Izhakiella capsodis TaxID=1367852 RepID=A0A1I4UJV6_9GAMM|nr:inner membrane protein YbjM [Izhakiella capsodis]SFM89175.1 Putative inner membrane protein [Izhakiella capsodis]
MFRSVSWSGVVACTIFYTMIFVTVRHQILMAHSVVHQAQPVMLLFLLPGAVSALTSKQAPLSVAVAGSLLATPFCLTMMIKGMMFFHSFWQECAFSISAIFWCGLGALSVTLGRALLEMRQGKQ